MEEERLRTLKRSDQEKSHGVRSHRLQEEKDVAPVTPLIANLPQTPIF